jgi:hypothetical protein
MTTDRDSRLGDALRELETAEHRPEFHRELRRLLAAEQAAQPRTSRLRWSIAAGTVAAIAAVAVIAVGIPHTRQTGPEPASAAVVQERLRAALTALRNLSGVLVETSAGGVSRWRFTLDAAGDARIEGPRAGDVTTYDASEGVARSAQHSASLGGETLFYAERRGVAPGPPDQGPPTWVIPDELSAYVRAALAAGDAAVRDVTYAGRPAWELDVHTIPNAIAGELSGDDVTITVDRTTGLPVRVAERKDGSVIRGLRIEDVQADRTLSARTFQLVFPAGVDVLRSNDGFRQVALDAVEPTVGYRPLVPAFVPDGYHLSRVAVAAAAAPAGLAETNPASRQVVSLSYRRGIERLVITTRLRGAGTWSDPLASPAGFVDRPERVDLGSGHAGELVVSPHALPHVWALEGGLVVTVAGDLSAAELLQVARSL